MNRFCPKSTACEKSLSVLQLFNDEYFMCPKGQISLRGLINVSHWNSICIDKSIFHNCCWKEFGNAFYKKTLFICPTKSKQCFDWEQEYNVLWLFCIFVNLILFQDVTICCI